LTYGRLLTTELIRRGDDEWDIEKKSSLSRHNNCAHQELREKKKKSTGEKGIN